MKTAYDITWEKEGKHGDADARGYWHSKDGRFTIEPNFRHGHSCRWPTPSRGWRAPKRFRPGLRSAACCCRTRRTTADSYTLTDATLKTRYTADTVRDCKDHARQTTWREWKLTHHTVQVTVGQALHRSVAELLKTLGVLYPGSFTNGSAAWTFPLTTELTPKQVQAKVWEKFVGVYCHVE